MELTILDWIRVHLDKAPALASLMAEYSRNSLDEPGCLAFVASRMSDDEFQTHQVYASQQALTAHRTSPHHLEFERQISFLEADVEHFRGQNLVPQRDRLGKAVVLGGGGGIGRASSLALAAAGYEVIVADLEASTAESAAQELLEAGLRARSAAVDVSDPQQLDALFEDVSRQEGSLDILVNSAGHIDIAEFNAVTDDQIDRMITVHLKGTMMAAKRASKTMRESGYGRIVNIASVAALKGAPDHSHYAAAKAGIVGFTKSVSLDLAGLGITVNCVLPGPIRTPLLDGLSEVALEQLAATPVGRIGTPEDVARTVLFLCSPEASFITGTTVLVAGGSWV